MTASAPLPTSRLSPDPASPDPGASGDGRGRLAAFDWGDVAASLDAQGWAVLPGLLGAGECRRLTALYDAEAGFRSHVHMARHGFGRGEYRYFSYPLPPLVAALRTALYARLAGQANIWAARLGQAGDFPAAHADFAARCHAAGQARPTPLLLRYGPGDYNCLHQDLYGVHVFPLQAAILLSAPGEDFTGGEFVLTEQRPRMQSRASVVPLARGDAVIFAVNSRPVRGTRGDYRVTMRHGVSPLHSGQRHTLGLIFHDAA
ncbi:MAG: 2OG-Fe(II) oxygenase [Sphingopyxis sp.]|uniref:2OG-Fe(II) oxygenase n=1 Tax=Sphingopyxis sp. TaxID=1908224 RepID=UPI002ABAB64B|nr:2OG-Fe(II) oxygenase [Sphingopyxis sp.]MDZ3830355.1 2OG-Fe(II) oxygenase [Sphingopyxis sp.]